MPAAHRLQGMGAQVTRLSVVANNIANSSTPDYQRQVASLASVNNGGTGGVEATVRNATTGAQADSSIEDMTDMIESSQSFALNADVFETGADMWQILSTIKRD